MANVFQAIIGVKDEASAGLRQIARNVAGVGRQIRGAGRTLVSGAAVTHARVQLSTVVGAFHRVEGSAKSAVEAVAKFAPAVGAIGVGGSLVALVGLTKSVADTRVEAVAAANKLGILPTQLAVLRNSAKMAGVDVGSMDGALVKLNKGVGLAVSGKNKDLAALFAHIGLDAAKLKTTNVATLMPILADAFAKTGDAALKTRVAMALFGKSGAELLPILNQGSDAIKKAQESFAGLGYAFTSADDMALARMRLSFMRVDVAMGGIKNAIAARLAPIIGPIVDQFATWIGKNKEFIATSIAGKVEALSEVLRKLWDVAKQIDWNQPIDALPKLGGVMWDVTGSVHGLHAVFGGLMLLMASPFITAAASAVTAIMSIGRAIGAVGLLMAANPIGLVITAVAAVGIAGYELYKHWDQVKAYMIPVVSQIQAAWAPIGDWFSSLFGKVASVFESAWARMKPIVDAIRSAAHFAGRFLPSISGPGMDGAPASLPVLPGPRQVPPLSTVPGLPSVITPAPAAVVSPRQAAAGTDAGQAGKLEVTFTGALPPGVGVSTRSTGAAPEPTLDVGTAYPMM